MIVEVGKGKDKMPACSRIEPALDYSKNETIETPSLTIPCFSMNQPFASLLAHGFKTLETRNSSILAPLEGRKVALHVGKNTYPDGGMHQVIMRRNVPSCDHNSMNESEIGRLTSLPEGFSRGAVVAIIELGETVLYESEQMRQVPRVELGAVATGQAMGRYITTIRSTAWLKPPGLRMKGLPGVFDVAIPTDLLPVDLILKMGKADMFTPLSLVELTSLRARLEIISTLESKYNIEGKSLRPTPSEVSIMEQRLLIEKMIKVQECREQGVIDIDLPID